jgi:hypothetical protein
MAETHEEIYEVTREGTLDAVWGKLVLDIFKDRVNG